MTATPFQKDFVVSWDALHRDARALAWRLLADGPYQRIIAITRGGLVPTAIVARELDLRLIDTVCVVSYDEQNKGNPRVLKSLEGDVSSPKSVKIPGFDFRGIWS